MLLTKRGYQINKKLLTNEQLKEIQDDLLVTPKLNPPYDFDNQPINLLHQTINNIFIPRYYGINTTDLRTQLTGNILVKPKNTDFP